MSSPLISIIIPTYNRANVLKRAVISVQKQNYQNCEIIICDDASTDNTVDVAKKMASQDSRIKIVRLLQNQGAAAARNEAMKVATGEYLAFLDSDDEWLEKKIATQVETFNKSNSAVGVCFTGAKILKNEIRCALDIPSIRWERDPLSALVTGQMSFTTSTIMIKRECFQNAGLMSLELRRGQDEDFLIRVFMQYGLVTIQDVFVTMHLTTYGKNHYTPMLAKEVYMNNKYYELLKQRVSNKNAKKFKAKLCLNVLTAALEERRYSCAITHTAKLYKINPILDIKAYKVIIKALLHGVFYKPDRAK